jgi:DNA-binding MarR family transcriptional regulator
MDATLEFNVGQDREFLATRSSGRSVRAELEDRIARERPDGVLIDFAGVAAMAISFADEFLGRFYTSLAAGDIPVQWVLLLGLNEETQDEVSICLERRELAAAAIIHEEHVLLGAPQHLVDTYRLALTLGTFSAVDLSAHLNISPQNANNRLKRLVAAGAVQRRRVVADRGGKEFAYTVPSPLPRLAAHENAL